MESHNERVGSLVKRYADNKALIAGLRDSIRGISNQLIDLHNQLQTLDSMSKISLQDSDTLHWKSGRVSTRVLAELAEKVTALNKAQEEQAHMQNCLRDAGLSELLSR